MSSILVATDFTPVSDLALELAVSMAQLEQCTLDVLHVLEFGRDNHLKLMHRASGDTLRYREQAREEASRHLEERVKSVDLPHPPAKHLLVGHADDVIPAYIDKNNIDLLIMGTLARTGIPGVFVGNTADRVLPKVSCSLLGVKPADFKSPVTVPAQHTAME